MSRVLQCGVVCIINITYRLCSVQVITAVTMMLPTLLPKMAIAESSKE